MLNILQTVFVFRECLPIRECSAFLFGFEGGMWYLVLLIPDHCLSIYFRGSGENDFKVLTIYGHKGYLNNVTCINYYFRLLML